MLIQTNNIVFIEENYFLYDGKLQLPLHNIRK